MPHRLINESREPALALAETNAPIIMDQFHNPKFIFECDFQFADRYNGSPDYFKVTEDIVHAGRGGDEEGGATTGGRPLSRIPTTSCYRMDDGRAVASSL